MDRLRFLQRLLVVLALVVPAARAAVWGQAENLALNRPYASSAPNQGGWTGLVDGVKDNDRAPGCFATDGTARFPKYVVIDLGTVCSLTRVEVVNSLNGNTRTVEIYAGTDGEKYLLLRRYVFPNGQLQTLRHEFPPHRARFLKVAFRDTYGGGLAGDNYIFIREVEVWGTRDGEPPPPVPAPATAEPRWARIFRHYALRAVGSRPPDLTVAVLGDCSALSPPDQPEISPFPEVFAALLRERLGAYAEPDDGRLVVVEGMAQERATARDCLARAADALALDPDIVIVSVGTCDALDWQEREFRQALNELVQRLFDNSHAALILVAPPPLRYQPGRPFAESVRGKTTGEAAAAVGGIATLSGALLADVPAAFQTTATPAANLYADNLHLSRVGHTLVAHIVFSALVGH